MYTWDMFDKEIEEALCRREQERTDSWDAFCLKMRKEREARRKARSRRISLAFDNYRREAEAMITRVFRKAFG